jgi:hypothetical protein
MTQEEKELLLKDLCSRLPYGVKISVLSWDEREMEYIDRVDVLYSVNGDEYIKSTNEDYDFSLEDIKPYLFPLSSMTDEQCVELRKLIYGHLTLDDEFNEGISFKTDGDIDVWFNEKPINNCYFIFDWLNKNHLDYRGLIEKSLAIDATGLNIY